MLTKEDIRRLESTQSQQEWDVICDDVKKKNGGSYPPDGMKKLYNPA